MGNSWIILVLLGVGWAIQAIAQAVAKKQEQERLRQVAEERRRAAQSHSGSGATTSRTSAQPSSPQLSTRPTSREELAARRQAQLEELRKRRLAQSRGQSTQVRTTPQQRPQPAARSQPVPVRRQSSTAAVPPQQPPSLQPESVPKRTQRPSQILKKKEEFTRLAEARRRQAEEEKRRSRAKRSKRLRQKPIDEQRLVAPSPLGPSAAAPDTLQLRSKLRQPRMLRELFVMKELLDPPVALREEIEPGPAAL